MSSTASPLLQIELQASGENNNSWGTLANGTFQRLEEAIAGVTAVTLSADTTLSDTTFSSNQSRSMVLNVTGAGGFNIIIPNRTKIYFVRNGSSSTAGIKTASGTAITVAAGDSEWVWCDGSNTVRRLSIPQTAVTGLSIATTAQFQANTASKFLTTDQVWAAADTVALTDAATIAVDLSTGLNFSVTLGGNRTLGNPTNTKNGQSGVIYLTQDATGSRTLTCASNWKFGGGAAPTLSTAAGAVDMLFYQAKSSTFIFATLIRDVK